MNQLYRAMKISKQAFHQYYNRLLIRLEEEEYLKVLIAKIRKDHSTMNCRDMYFKINPKTMGRDAFEDFCREEGYMVKHKRRFQKTTNSNGVKRFENLTLDLNLTTLDQLWVSDITYFEVHNCYYYLTFILDVYTRRILGYSVSKDLNTESTTLPAIRMAIKCRNKSKLTGLIFHSDGGGQYYAIKFLKLTQKYGIINSMCKYPWENPYAERINGIIKNNYLIHWIIESFEELVKAVDRAVYLYNNQKPHKSLKRLTPIKFEECIFKA